jgi:hypothetical protein
LSDLLKEYPDGQLFILIGLTGCCIIGAGLCILGIGLCILGTGLCILGIGLCIIGIIGLMGCCSVVVVSDMNV